MYRGRALARCEVRLASALGGLAQTEMLAIEITVRFVMGQRSAGW